MDTSAITRMLAQGDLSSVIDALAVDERVDYAQASVSSDAPDRTVTLARVGVLEILVQAPVYMDGELATPGLLKAHTHESETDARECFRVKADELGEMIIRHNAAAREVQTNEQAQVMLRMGFPPEMIVQEVMQRQAAEITADLSGYNRP